MLRNLDCIQNLMESSYKILKSWPTWCKLQFFENHSGEECTRKSLEKAVKRLWQWSNNWLWLGQECYQERWREVKWIRTYCRVGKDRIVIELDVRVRGRNKAWLLFLTWYLGGFDCPLVRKNWWEASSGQRGELHFGDIKFDIA